MSRTTHTRTRNNSRKVNHRRDYQVNRGPTETDWSRHALAIATGSPCDVACSVCEMQMDYAVALATA